MSTAHGAGRVNVPFTIYPVHALVPGHPDRSGAIVQDEETKDLYVLREGVGVDLFTLLNHLSPGPNRCARVVLSRPLVYLLGAVVDVEAHLVAVLVLHGLGIQEAGPAEANTRTFR